MNEAHDALVRKIRSSLVAGHPTLVENCIRRLYARQTADEQSVRVTRHWNERGFQHTDAREFSLAAEILNAGGVLLHGSHARYGAKLAKYREQLAWIAEDLLLEARGVPSAE